MPLLLLLLLPSACTARQQGARCSGPSAMLLVSDPALPAASAGLGEVACGHDGCCSCRCGPAAGSLRWPAATAKSTVHCGMLPFT
jgi:hypothetical protein